jgi:hypothetical protein
VSLADLSHSMCPKNGNRWPEKMQAVPDLSAPIPPARTPMFLAMQGVIIIKLSLRAILFLAPHEQNHCFYVKWFLCNGHLVRQQAKLVFVTVSCF